MNLPQILTAPILPNVENNEVMVAAQEYKSRREDDMAREPPNNKSEIQLLLELEFKST